MIDARRKEFTQRWAGTQTVYEPDDVEPPSIRTKPPIEWTCGLVNRIIAKVQGKTLRLWTVDHSHWDEDHKLWVCWAYQWNRFRKDWSDSPRLIHCREFELEDEPI